MAKKSRLFSKDTLLHLRIPYSLFLSPVFFLALAQWETILIFKAVLSFLVLHLFIYPSSQAFNSFYDRDSKSIGGLENPPKVFKELLLASWLLDFAGLALSLFLGIKFAIGILVLIIMSRMYSHPKIRLKKYPLLSWITVALFQGGFVYMLISSLSTPTPHLKDYIMAFACSLLIGGAYPLTQVYQHEEDQKRSDITLSILLGIRGTFVFSLISTTIGFVLLSSVIYINQGLKPALTLGLLCLPGFIFFSYWSLSSFLNEKNANFKNSMKASKYSSLGIIIYGILFLYNSIAQTFF